MGNVEHSGQSVHTIVKGNGESWSTNIGGNNKIRWNAARLILRLAD
jgi:hypothetical protein